MVLTWASTYRCGNKHWHSGPKADRLLLTCTCAFIHAILPTHTHTHTYRLSVLVSLSCGQTHPSAAVFVVWMISSSGAAAVRQDSFIRLHQRASLPVSPLIFPVAAKSVAPAYWTQNLMTDLWAFNFDLYMLSYFTLLGCVLLFQPHSGILADDVLLTSLTLESLWHLNHEVLHSAVLRKADIISIFALLTGAVLGLY